MSALSVALSVFVLNCHHRGTRLNRPHKTVRTMSRFFARMFCMRLIYLDNSHNSNSPSTHGTSINKNMNHFTRYSDAETATNRQCHNLPSLSSRNSHLLPTSSSTVVQSTPTHRIQTLGATGCNGSVGSNLASESVTSNRRGPESSRNLVESHILQYLQAVLEAYDRGRGERIAVLEWQEVARILDKFFFWVSVAVTTVITVFLLLLSPVAKRIEFPYE